MSDDDQISEETDAQADDADNPDLNDKGSVARRTKRLTARNELRKRFLQNLLATPEGREWIWNLLTITHCFQTSFVAGDPHASAFKEGERNVGLSILAQIPPEAFELLLKEGRSSNV